MVRQAAAAYRVPLVAFSGGAGSVSCTGGANAGAALADAATADADLARRLRAAFGVAERLSREASAAAGRQVSALLLHHSPSLIRVGTALGIHGRDARVVAGERAPLFG